jgi:FKBP-type peptidyl-prolyl cis-trans isomerase FkpA
MSPLSRRYALAAAAAIALAACGDKAKTEEPSTAPPAAPPAAAAPAPAGAVDPATATYDASLQVDISKMTRTANGLYFRDVVVGTGARADSGTTVSVNYTGWLPNGSKFDSSDGSPIEFPLGMHRVVDGWDQGLPGMKVGGKRQLVIPSSLGYGDAGRPPQIPGGAVMVFSVELMGVKK